MTRVLVQGAGIAGPALALLLARHGMSVTVVDHAPAPRRGGQTVDLRGASREVVSRLGLAAAVRERSVPQRGIVAVDAKDRVRATMSTTDFDGQGIVSDLEILRGDLVDVLLDASRDLVDHRFGDAVTGLAGDARGVDVTFRHGRPERFDTVVGADGVRSGLRPLALGPGDPRRPIGCATAWFTVPAYRDLDGWYRQYNAPGGRVASVRPGRLPGELKAALWFRTDRRDLPGDRDARLALFTDTFHGVGWDVPQLLAGAADADDLAAEVLGQVRLPAWSRGRVGLVGDAAFCPSPLTGLGTALAMVGGYVLACELAARPDVPATAFRRYEDRLRAYVLRAQALPPGGVRGFAPATRAGIALQHASMRMLTSRPVRRWAGGIFQKADGLDLPDHPDARVR